ncbi:MAG: DNA mismatch repair protein MutS, partial [Angelakisella sp.]
MDAATIAKMSPMMQKYFELKNRHPDQLLFFRLGDFYEMFFDDALLVSRELELTLTGRDCGLEERAPMCGVPYHSVEGYIARLIKKGYRVAICEQLENPALAKGMVKRDIVRVVTPGTLIESSFLDEGTNNYICAIFCGNGYGLAFCDISTGEMNVTQLSKGDDTTLQNELGKFHPNEIIFNGKFLDQKAAAAFIKEKLCCTADLTDEDTYLPETAALRVLRQFNAASLEVLGLADIPLAVSALGGLLCYLDETQRLGLERLQKVCVYTNNQFMALDPNARRNLELTETMRSREKKGSLLWVLDHTKTSMGRRRIRLTLEQPLVSATAINRRLNAVEELTENSILLAEVTEALGGIYDMERLMTRIIYGNASPRDLVSLGMALQRMPGLRMLLSEVHCQELQEIYSSIDLLEDVCGLIRDAVDDQPPITLKDGGVIRDGYSKELDDLRYLSNHTKELIANIEAKERERSGIKNLKISYNKVFGYYMEVTRSNLAQVPEDYIRKQTLSNCERYITGELKDLETKVLGAQQQIVTVEATIFESVRLAVGEQLERIQRTAEAVAALDVLCSFATAATRY